LTRFIPRISFSNQLRYEPRDDTRVACDARYPDGIRDRALLIVGYFGLLRRSEPVAIEVAHIAFAPERVGGD